MSVHRVNHIRKIRPIYSFTYKWVLLVKAWFQTSQDVFHFHTARQPTTQEQQLHSPQVLPTGSTGCSLTTKKQQLWYYL